MYTYYIKRTRSSQKENKMKTYKVIIAGTVVNEKANEAQVKSFRMLFGARAAIIENIPGLQAMIDFIKTPNTEMYPTYGDSAIQKLFSASR